jgi:hypothetical protein
MIFFLSLSIGVQEENTQVPNVVWVVKVSQPRLSVNHSVRIPSHDRISVHACSRYTRVLPQR